MGLKYDLTIEVTSVNTEIYNFIVLSNVKQETAALKIRLVEGLDHLLFKFLCLLHRFGSEELVFDRTKCLVIVYVT